MKRLFTFGCSFTNYCWPTWADAIGTSFFDEYYNYGRPGACGRYMSEHLVRAHHIHDINKNDVVMMMWSTFDRETRYLPNNQYSKRYNVLGDGWFAEGSVAGQYDKSYLNYVDAIDLIHKHLMFVDLCHSFLQNIGCEYHMLSMIDINEHIDYCNQCLHENYQELKMCDVDLDMVMNYPALQNFIPSVYSLHPYWEYDNFIGNFDFRIDSHPLPDEHIHFLQQAFPEYGLKLPDKTLQVFDYITKKINQKSSEYSKPEDYPARLVLSDDWVNMEKLYSFRQDLFNDDLFTNCKLTILDKR